MKSPGRRQFLPGCAVIWDFDGTLVDSRRKNLSVNRAIIERITRTPADSFEPLTSVAAYDAAVARCTNWRDFYAVEFGLTASQVKAAAGLWIDCQLRDRTAAPPYAGVAETVRALAHWPQGIVSQNSSTIIAVLLDASGLAGHFGAVFGFEEVEIGRQKPAPDALVKCAESLTGLEPGVVFYVGDHYTDALCAARARDELAARGLAVDVVSIAAAYGADGSEGWSTRPDYVACRPADVADIVTRRLRDREGRPAAVPTPDRPAG